MRVSTKTQYGLRILLHVAQDTQLGRLAQGKDIASRQQINEPYLEQIMVILKKAGLVTTVRGRRGGYQLAREPQQITLLEIIETFEGGLALAETPEGGGATSPEALAGEAVWGELAGMLRAEAGDLTLAAVLAKCETLDPDYII